MDTQPKFILKYGVSKKGNKTITVAQIPDKNYPYAKEQGFSCSQKYRDVVKIKTVADRDYFKNYLDKTVEEVFVIAFQEQNWRLIPFSPITVSVVLDPVDISDDVYFKGDWND